MLRLGESCLKIGSGATPSGGKESYSEDGPVSLIRSQNVYDNSFTFSGLARISELQAEGLRNVEVQSGDVLLNITGDSVARVCQVDDRALPARVNQHVAIIRPDPRVLDSRFLKYYLVSPKVKSQLLSLASAGATRNALTKAMIERLEVPCWSLPTQRRVASILGSLDDKIVLLRRMNRTLEDIGKAVFKDWFIDFGPTRAKVEGREPYFKADSWSLFPDRFDNQGLPLGWRTSRLGDHLQNFDSKRVPLSSRERERKQGLYPYHGATGIMDYVDDYLFDGTYLLVGEDGSVINDEGVAFTQYVNGKIWVNNHAHVLQGRGSVSTEQLLLFFKQEQIVPYVTGAVQAKLSQGQMNSIPFVFAGEHVCKAFSEMVQPLFHSIIANNKENENLASLRDLLLPRLMAGEVSLKDTDGVLEKAM